MTPSVVSILARWLPSRMSSTISGWRSERLADAQRQLLASATSGRPRRGVGSASRPGRSAMAASPSSRGARRRRSRRPGWRPASRSRRGADGGRPGPPDAPDRGSEGEAGFGWLEAIGVASSGAGSGRADRVGSRRSRPDRGPAYASATGPAAEGERRRDRDDGHDAGDDEQPDHDRRRLARRPFLERLDDEARRAAAGRAAPPG